MKQLSTTGLAVFVGIPLILASSIMMTGCTKVPSGYEGVKVHLLGTKKGVDVETVGVGKYWLGFNTEMHRFPMFTQNYPWTKDVTEGSANDESMTFQTRGGLVVSADIGIAYRIAKGRSAAVFQKYRKGVDEITGIHLRNSVRDALVRTAESLTVESVYGKGKSKLLDDAFEIVKAEFAPNIIIEKLYWIGKLRLPNVVITAINAKIMATQKAQQRENEIAETEAAAAKRVAKAKGEAEAKLLIAEAEAKSIEVVARALANNPTVLELEAVKKWNGALPAYFGGGVNSLPFISGALTK